MNDRLLLSIFFMSFLAMSLIMIPAKAQDFLEGVIENYGNGTTTIGELWTGYGASNFRQYIREAEFTVTRQVNQTYPDFPVLIDAVFPIKSQAPIWFGMAQGGVYYEPQQRTIKVLYEEGGVEEEIPSQISYHTTCFSPDGYDEVPCTSTNYRIRNLQLKFNFDMQQPSYDFRVVYPISFGDDPSGLPTEYYKFEYNETTGKYIESHGSNAVYDPIIMYDVSEKRVNMTYGDNPTQYANLGDDYAITTWIIGNCPSHNQGNMIECTGGTMEIFGLPIAYDIYAPVVLETQIYDCNLGGLGADSGHFYIDWSPMMTKIDIESTEELITPTETAIIDMYSRATSSCFGYCSFTGGLYTWVNQAYSNATNEAMVTGTGYNTTGTSYSHQMGMMRGCWSSGGVQVGMPMNFAYKSELSTDSMLGDRLYSYGWGTANGGSCANDVNVQVRGTTYTNQTISGGHIVYFTAPRTDNNGACTVDEGYADWDDFGTIIKTEDFGGSMDVGLLWNDFDEPCEITTDNYCVELTSYNIDGLPLECSSLGLGFEDNCGDWHTCIPCTTCTDTMATEGTMYCDGVCFGIYYDNQCLGGDVWGNSTCTGVSVVDECGNAGCDNNQCRDPDTLTEINTQVFDYLYGSALGGVNVTFSGYVYGNEITDSCITTANNGCLLWLPPTSYNVTGSRSGYATGCVNPYSNFGVKESSTGSYCTVQVQDKEHENLDFDLRPVGASATATSLLIHTTSGLNDLAEVNVTVCYNSTDCISALTNTGGEHLFYWESGDEIIDITAIKDGYDTYTHSIPVVPSRDNTWNVFMSPNQDVQIATGRTGNTKRIIMMGNNKANIPLNFTKPGKVTITRADISVKGCADVFCSNYKLYASPCINMLGIEPGGNIMATKVDPSTVEELGTVYVREEFMREAMEAGDCRWMDTDALGRPVVDNSTGLVRGSCDIACNKITPGESGTCEYISYFKFGSDFTIPEHAHLAIRSAGNFLGSTLNTIMKTARSAWDMLTKGNQDVMVEEVVFQCNDALFTDFWSSEKKTVWIDGQIFRGYLKEIILNPAYRPYLRTGKVPYVTSNGDVGLQDTSSKPLGIGLDRTDWNTFITSELVESGRTWIEIDKEDLVGDVETDLRVGKYDTMELRYLEPTEYIEKPKTKLDPTKFETNVYLRIQFEPSDGSTPSEEFVRVIAYTHNYDPNPLRPEMLFWYGLGFFAFIPVIIALWGIWLKNGNHKGNGG